MSKALVLAGGGSLGAYQVGAVKCMLEKGERFDIITGTSIGALNGALLCTGDYEKLRTLWLEITPDKVMKDGMNFNKDAITSFDIAGSLSFLLSYVKSRGADITPFKRLCAKYIDPKRIKESKVRLGIVTVSFPGLKEVRVELNKAKEKDILPFLHASSACVPIFPIETVAGSMYIDGFYKNNVPIDYAISMGADEIVCVDMNMLSFTPQHSELLRLPNVKLITPSKSLGSIMDFTPEVILANMNQGYADAKKEYGDYIGFDYSFLSKDVKQAAESFKRSVLSMEEDDMRKAVKWLMDAADAKGLDRPTPEQLLLLPLEHLLSKAKTPTDELLRPKEAAYSAMAKLIEEEKAKGDGILYRLFRRSPQTTVFRGEDECVLISLASAFRLSPELKLLEGK